VEFEFMARLQDYYKNTVIKELQEKFGYQSIMQVPKIEKITLNMGLGEAVGDKKIVDRAVGDMTLIAGQKPVVTKARKSVAGFKIREDWPIGCKVTLRRERMYEFLDRLVSVAIPRIRDFRGFSGKAFDGRGNYSLGVKEQIIFPEIDYDKIDVLRGMDITITTSARTDEEGRALLVAFNFPLK
jgi:large subunit ribosomal protein L5